MIVNLERITLVVLNRKFLVLKTGFNKFYGCLGPMIMSLKSGQ